MELDQSVVAMMKAIAQQESGNKAVLPQEKGIGGASIYQYTTSTWKGVAKKYLGDENAPLNRANENKATYQRIKGWKDAGYKPAQIASMWNAGEGEPDAYKGTFKNGQPSVGVNSYGVRYDTPSHAKKVIANFQNEMAKIKKQEQKDRIAKENVKQVPYTPQTISEEGYFKPSPLGVRARDVLREGVNMFTPGLKIIGETFTGGLASKTKDVDEAIKAQSNLDEMNRKLVMKIGELKKQGRDTSNLEELYKRNTGNRVDIGNLIPASKITNEQLAGALGEVGLDILSAGTYGAAAKTMRAGQLAAPLLKESAELVTRKTIPTALGQFKAGIKPIVAGAATGYGYDVASGLQTGEEKPFTPGIGTAIGTGVPFLGLVGSKAKGLTNKVERNIKNIQKVEDEIAKIERNYAKTRPLVDKTASARKLLAQSDLLPSAIQDGTIYTTGKGGSIDKFFDATIGQFEGQGGIVRIGLQNEGIAISPNIVKEQLRKSILNSNLEGAELKRALNKVDDEVEGLMLKSNSDGNIKLENLQDAKIFTTKNIDYTKPTSKLEAKAFANAYKTLIENNSKLNIKEVNSELAKYYAVIDLLEMLDGKKVKGGKLGTYAARVGGQIAGSAVGGAIGGFPGMAVGTITGGETAAKIQSLLMSRTFGKGVGTGIQQSKILQEASTKYPKSRLLLPEKSTFKEKPILLPAKTPKLQGQIISPSDVRTKKIPLLPKKLYQGTDNGLVKIDKFGNVNLSTDKNLSRFGKTKQINVSKLNILPVENKEKMFSLVKPENKAILKKQGIDGVFSDNHAIITSPEKLNVKFREDIYNKQIGKLNKANKIQSNLIQEAKKETAEQTASRMKAEEKSFEEFLKAQPKVYHVTAKKNFKNIKKKGLLPNEAEGSEGIEASYVFKDYDEAVDFMNEVFDGDQTYGVLEIPMLKSDYKKLKADPFQDRPSAVYFEGIIKPKSQLEEIWNKARK